MKTEWRSLSDDPPLPYLNRLIVTDGRNIYIATFRQHYLIVPPEWLNHTAPYDGERFDPEKLTHWMFLPDLPGKDTE